MAKKTLPTPKMEKPRKKAEKPKRLSKFAEWLKANPGPHIEIHDLKAILK